jgi:hypothetical protein
MPRRFWNALEEAYLVDAYPDTPTAELALALRRPVRAVYQKALALGLKKSPSYLASPHACRLRRGDDIGASHRFQPGAKPWNAGLKGWTAGGRSAETRFKAGRTPQEAANYKPVGSLRLSRDGYLVRKMTDSRDSYPARRWVALHRLVWEATHGPVPAGHIIAFKPGLKTTVEEEVTLDRLECITRAENMARNTCHQYPKEVAEAIQLKGALTRQINKRSQHGQVE